MSDGEPDVDWARSADFSTPVRWGEVEAEILARPAPRFAPGEYDGPLTATKVVGVSGVATMLLAVPLVVAPLIGLLLVHLRSTGVLVGPAALQWTFYVHLASAVMLMLVVLTWVEDRRRCSRSTVAQVVVSALASSGAFALTRSSPESWTGSSIPQLTVGIAVAGWVVLAVLVLGSSSWARRTAARDRPDQTEAGAGYMAARVAVIEVLIRRGIVERADVDVTAMMEMPLGSWEELDRPAR